MWRFENKERRWIALLLTVVVLAAGNSEIMSFWGSSYKVLAAEMAEGNAEEAGKIVEKADDGNAEEEKAAGPEDIVEEGQFGDGEDAKDMAALLASGDNIASGVIDEDYGHITWVIDADGKLTVEGTGDFTDLNSSSYSRAPWSDYTETILSAEVNVTGIKDASYMFYGCEKLMNLDVSQFDTSQVTDMSNMFRGCDSLPSLDVSKFNTNQVTDMSRMFDWCSGLSSLDVSKFDTSQVTDMSWMFYECSGLSSLDVSKFDTSQVTNMDHMFAECSGLINLDVSKFDTSRVTDMSWMFLDCDSLSSLDVSKFDTSQVTDMRGMFDWCSGLTSLDISKFDTSQVTDMSMMFYACSGLASLDVSKFDTSQVTNMISMFNGCSGLTSLDVSKFDTGQVTDMGGMFGWCSGLTSLDISKFDTRQVTDMGCMFNGCSGLTSLDVSKFDTSQVTNMDHMFAECSGLISLDVSKFDTSQVTDMGWMFSDCSGLTSLDISKFDTRQVTDMREMLDGCHSLHTVHTPRNLSHTIPLPTSDDSDKWYCSDGTIVTELPQGLNHSVVLGKNYIPEEKPGSSHIIQKELIDTGTYVFQFLNKLTGVPIKNGRVRIEIEEGFSMEKEHCYETDESGCVYVPVTKNCERIFVSPRFESYENTGGWVRLKDHLEESGVYTFNCQPRTSKYIPKLPSVKATVDTSGPDVEADGKDYSLFNMKQDFTFDFGKGVKVISKYDDKDKTTKIVFSGEEKWLDYDTVEHQYKDKSIKSLWEQWEKMMDSTDKTGKIGNVDVRLIVSGYLRFDLLGNLIEGGAVVALKGGGEVEYRPVCTGGLCYGKFKAEITAEGTIKFVYTEGNLTTAAVIKLEPAINIAVGAGWKMAHVEVGANGSMPITFTFPWKNKQESMLIDAKAEIYGEAKFLWVCGRDSHSYVYNIWPGKNSGSGGGGSTWSVKSFGISSDTLTVMPRDYLASNGTGIPSVVRADGADNLSPVYAGGTGAMSAADSFRYSEVSVDSGVFPENNVQYVQLAGGTEILAWVHDFGDKSDTNRTTLVYSVNKNDGTGWSSITPVCSDTSTGDYYPTMAAEGDKAYLVWNKASEVFGDTADADHAMKHMDVCLSVFENGAFTAPELLSAPSNDVMEFSPMVAADGEKVAVAWLVNSENDYHYTKGSNALYVREYRNGAWGDEVCFAKGLHFVSDYDLGYVDGQVAVAYAEDADGVSDTEDGTAHLVVAGMRDTSKIADTKAAAAAAAMAAASGTVTDTVVCDGSYNATMVDICGNALYFSGKDGICKASGKGFSHISDTGIKTDNFVVARNAVGGEAVTFLAQDGYTSNIYVSYCRDGSYTSPVSLVADGSRVTHYVPLCNADGTVSVAYNEDEVLTGAEYPYGLTDMVVKRKADPDLFFVDDTLVYNAYDVAPGGKLEFSALAHNYTSQDVTAVQATLKGSVSGTVYEGKLDAAIPVGESAYVTVPYTLPGTVVNENFTLTLTPVDFADKDLSDNAATCELGYSDIAVTECRIENNIITGTVKNVGYKTASNVTLAIREDDQDQEPFAALTYTGGSLAVGESWEFTQAVAPVTYQSPGDAKYYLVAAGTDSIQNNYANDSATVHSEPIAATGITLDRTTLAMTEKTTAILTATVAPATATFKEVKYTSGDNSVVLVDGQGNLYAVGVGSTVVTVYTADCNYSAECTVTVEAMAEGTTGKDYVLSDRGLDLELGEEAELTLMEEADPAGSGTAGSGGSSGSSTPGTAVTGAVWTSTDEQVVTVDENGKVKATGEGIALVIVKAGAYVDACIVRVRDYSIKQLCCEEDSLDLAIGDSFQLDVSILPENTTMSKALTYASEDETVAAVDADGLVTAVSEGSTTVTVTSVNGVVLRIPVVVSEPFIYTIRLDAAGGEGVEPLKIRAQKVVTQDDEFYSEDYIAYPLSIPETRRKGYVFKGWYSERDGKGALLSTETPVRGDAVYYAHWEEAVYKVTLDRESMELKLGESAQIHVSVTPDDGAEVAYSTENSSIVTVTENGLVTGAGLGTAVVTVTAGNGSASCRITVTEGQEKPGTGEGTDEGNDQPGLHVKLPDGLIYTYTGSPVKPKVIVTNNGSRLTEGMDYTVKYSANVNAADQSAGKKAPKITITGRGSFAGSASVNFTIRPKSFADGIGKGNGATGSGNGGTEGSMTGNSDSLPELWYSLELHVAENTKAMPVLFYGIKRLGSKDYDLSTDATKVVKPGKVTGDGKLYLIGRGNFTGVAEIKVKAVANAALKTLAVSPKKGFQPVYDGKEHKPVFGGSGADVEVTAKGAAGELKEEKDYHVVYSEDVTNAGTVKYFIVGMGDCTGVVGKSYKINPVRGSEADFKVDFADKSSGYAYSPAGVTVNGLAVTYTGGQGGGKALTPGRDYKAAYSNNKKAGTAKLKITFLGNYKGSRAKTESFTITQGYLDAKGYEAKVAVPDKVYKKAGVYNSAPVVAVDGVMVKASDYKLSYEYQDGSGKWQPMDGSNKLDLEKLGKDSAAVRVKITGAGNYSSDAAHSLTAEYRVHKLGTDGIDLSRAKVTFYDEKGNKNKFGYTGKEVVPHRVEVTCKAGKDNITLVEGKDYTVTYVNNVRKGKAAAVITGTAVAGSGGKVFCGSKSAGFAIASMNLRDSAVFDNVSAAGSKILEFLLEAAY